MIYENTCEKGFTPSLSNLTANSLSAGDSKQGFTVYCFSMFQSSRPIHLWSCQIPSDAAIDDHWRTACQVATRKAQDVTSADLGDDDDDDDDDDDMYSVYRLCPQNPRTVVSFDWNLWFQKTLNLHNCHEISESKYLDLFCWKNLKNNTSNDLISLLSLTQFHQVALTTAGSDFSANATGEPVGSKQKPCEYKVKTSL